MAFLRPRFECGSLCGDTWAASATCLEGSHVGASKAVGRLGENVWESPGHLWPKVLALACVDQPITALDIFLTCPTKMHGVRRDVGGRGTPREFVEQRQASLDRRYGEGKYQASCILAMRCHEFLI